MAPGPALDFPDNHFAAAYCIGVLAEAGLWTKLYQTDPFVSMPGGDAVIKHAVYVYSVT